MALDVVSELVSDGEQFTFLVIGPVDAQDKDLFQKYLERDDLKQTLIYIPWIDLSELKSYLLACHIALAPFEKNPQHESGIANKIFQYMYGGLPIIASDCKPQKELIEHYDIGRIFQSKKEFKSHLRELLGNEGLRKELGERSRRTLLEEFDPGTINQKIIAMYDELAIKIR